MSTIVTCVCPQKLLLHYPQFVQAYVQFEAHLLLQLTVLVESSVQRTNFVAILGNVKCTLLFAILLSDKDGNRLIDQVWIPFWCVMLVPLLHVNNNSLV